MNLHGASSPEGGRTTRFPEVARRAVRDLPNLLSLLVFFTVTALLFRSVEFALIVTASLGFHELGHVAALAWLGLDWRIYFGFVGAWTWSSRPERERLSQLANALIHLSGPAFSLLLALVALALQAVWQPPDLHLLVLASFSAQVGFLNLLPLGVLTDGGKMVRRLVASLDGERRPRAVFLPMLVTAVMLVLYGLIEMPHLLGSEATPFLLELLLVGLWLASSLFIEARRAARTAQAALIPVTGGRMMTPVQAYSLILIMWGLLALALVLIAITPFWLTPKYLLGSLKNIAVLLEWIFRVI